MPGPDRNILRLTMMIQMIESIQRRNATLTVEQFAESNDDIDLLAFRLSQIGEHSQRLSPEIRNRHPDIPWTDVRGLRNLVVHEYHRVSPARLWLIAENRLEALLDVCRRELQRLTT
jgi:uncharacterized protein with HEPN domain